jgi:hypothetical protein
MPYYVSDAENTSSTKFRYPSQYLMGGTITSADALAGFRYSVPASVGGIVTSGLVMNFDAGDIRSYPGSGSIWYDISGTNNVTLVNAVQPSGFSYAPYITFNGTSAYAVNNSASNPLSGTNNATIMAWIYPDVSQPDGTYSGIFALGTKNCSPGGVSLLFSMKSNREMTMAKWCDDSTNGTLAPSANTWSMVSLTKSGAATRFGINGQTFQNTSNTGTSNFSGSTLTIGCTDTPGRYFKGHIAAILLYRTALTDDQILQNFEATRNKYLV